MRKKICCLLRKTIEPLISKDKHLTYFTCCLASLAFAFVEFFKLLNLFKDYYLLKNVSLLEIYEVKVEAIEVLMTILTTAILLFMVIKTYDGGKK